MITGSITMFHIETKCFRTRSSYINGNSHHLTLVATMAQLTFTSTGNPIACQALIFRPDTQLPPHNVYMFHLFESKPFRTRSSNHNVSSHRVGIKGHKCHSHSQVLSSVPFFDGTGARFYSEQYTWVHKI